MPENEKDPELEALVSDPKFAHFEKAVGHVLDKRAKAQADAEAAARQQRETEEPALFSGAWFGGMFGTKKKEGG